MEVLVFDGQKLDPISQIAIRGAGLSKDRAKECLEMQEKLDNDPELQAFLMRMRNAHNRVMKQLFAA